MSNPNIPNFLGMSVMTDTLEFMKNMWGSMGGSKMGLPGMAMPSLSVEEIDKQIKDLKAVEAWLNVNMSMLRGTIQALEVQSATISTLQSMGQSLSAAVSANTKSAANTASAGSAAELKSKSWAEQTSSSRPSEASGESNFNTPFANPTVWWNMLQDQFKQAVNAAMVPPEAVAPPEVDEPEVAPPEVGQPMSPAKAPPRKRKTPPKV